MACLPYEATFFLDMRISRLIRATSRRGLAQIFRRAIGLLATHVGDEASPMEGATENRSQT
jgi:hypothetical protein